LTDENLFRKRMLPEKEVFKKGKFDGDFQRRISPKGLPFMAALCFFPFG